MPNMCGCCWRWWRQRGDRAAKFAGEGSRTRSADLDGQRSDGYALWIRSAGGTRASGHWGEPAKRPSVCVPFAARRSVEDSSVGPGRLRTVVQAAGTWGFQTAASRAGRTIGGVACQRAGDDSGWDRCFEAEARAALPTRSAKRRINKFAKKKTKTTHKIITVCATKFLSLRLSRYAHRRELLERL